MLFGDRMFDDANTISGGAMVVRTDLSIYRCMACFLHVEGAHTEKYLNCLDKSLKRKTRLTGSRCSDALNFLAESCSFSLRLRYKKGLLSALLTPVAASSSLICGK